MMRRCIWRAVARRCGHGLQIGSGVGFKHLETFEIGDGVFIGAQAYIQGRFDGTTIIGDHVWIGPQAYMDARDLVLEDYVGWGPGAKVLGSSHTGIPADVPIVHTDLEIKPVRICAWADIGTNATILPGVTVGRGAIVGAGAVVTHDVAAVRDRRRRAGAVHSVAGGRARGAASRVRAERMTRKCIQWHRRRCSRFRSPSRFSTSGRSRRFGA